MTGTVAERALLGSLLLDPSVFAYVEGRVSGDDFSDQRMGAIFEGIVRMLAAGDPVNAVSVSARLADWQVRNLGADQLHLWVSEVPFAYRAAEFADVVRDDALRRGLADVARRYLEAAQDHSWKSPDAVARAVEELQALQKSSAGAGFIARKLSEVLGETDEYEWLIPGLLERRDRLVVTGAEGAGKTTFVRQLAILSAAGIHPMRFEPIDPVRVLVVDAENTERQWRRAVRGMVQRAGLVGAADPADVVHIMAGMRIDITRGSHLSEIHRLVDRYEPDVLFIGPLYKLVPGAINSDDDAAPLIVALDSLRDRGLGLVMEAHAGHAMSTAGERDLRPRGSSALLGWPEFGFGLRRLDADPEFARIQRWRGDREARDWPRHLRQGRRDDRGVLLPGEWPWMPTTYDDGSF